MLSVWQSADFILALKLVGVFNWVFLPRCGPLHHFTIGTQSFGFSYKTISLRQWKTNFSLSIHKLNINCAHHPLRSPAALLGALFFSSLWKCWPVEITWPFCEQLSTASAVHENKWMFCCRSCCWRYTRIVKSFSCLVLVEKKRLDGKTKHVYEFCLAITLGDQWTTNHRANLHSSLNDFISFANRNAIKLSLVWPQTFHVTQIPRRN